MLQRVARFLTRKPAIIVAVAVLLLIPSAIGAVATRINYDTLSYLPQEFESAQGERVLEEVFQSAATTMLMIEDMPLRYAEELYTAIEEVPGVSSVTWLPNMTDISIPKEIYPSGMQDMFFSERSTLMIVQYDQPGASDETMQAIEEIRKICNKQCFLAGFSVIIKDTRDLVDREMPLYVGIAVLLSLLAMWFAIEQWLLPLTFIVNIGFAIAYNFGSNIFLGEISYITKAIAAILQLGVSMDYSIFLVHRYQEEKENYSDKRDAMAQAIQSAFVSLSGSSLTTVAGFLALCFMQLLLGRDIGLVMAKGVIFSVLSVILILPALVLLLDGPIERYRHRNLIPDFTRVNTFIIRHSKGLSILFLVLLFPAYYAQKHTVMYYNLDRTLPDDLPAIVATNKLKDDYDMSCTHFVIVDDTLSADTLHHMVKELEHLDGIQSVVAYNKFLGPAIPDSFISEDVKDVFKKDGLQMMMITSKYQTATDELNAQVDQMNDILKRYDPNALITGEGALTKDLIETSDVDFRVTNYISVAAIILIIGIVFQSFSIPVLLVAVIKLAIFINEGIPMLMGVEIPFISPTVIGAIQLGATVDYAILMATRFREELQNGHDRDQAMLIAANTSDPSIVTSSLVLFCATLGVGIISDIEIISSICTMLARGAVISSLISIFILPAILHVCEPVIARTSRYWRTARPAKKEQVAEVILQ